MAATQNQSPERDQDSGENQDCSRTWLARRLFPLGTDPDARFTLANERTFLAWTRTSLAFLAGGIALTAFPLPNVPEGALTLVSILVILAGMAISAGATVRWIRVERAMRTGKSLPVPMIIPVLSLAALIACVFAIGILIEF